MNLQELRNHAHATIDKLIDATMEQARQSIATEARGVLENILGAPRITGQDEPKLNIAQLADSVRVLDEKAATNGHGRRGGRRKKKDGRSKPRTPKQIAAARKNVKKAQAGRRRKAKEMRKLQRARS